MRKMKKVLFIACHFPPTDEIGGSVRSEKLVKYLGDYGWKPKVVSLKEKGSRADIEIYPDVVRIQSLTPYIKPYQLTPYGWAYNVWRKLKEKNEYDLIYVSCPPFPQILAAIFLKKKFQLPLVLDFRDAWSLDPNQEGSKLKRLVYKYVFPSFERYAFEVSDHIVLNTPSVKNGYQALYPEYAEKMSWIPNGYDEEDFKGNTFKVEKNQKKIMTLLYCGRFGVCGRSPLPLLNAISRIKNDINIKLVIYGNQPVYLKDDINKMELGEIVSLRGQIPHKDVISKMYEHDVLVIYQETPLNDFPSVASKTYDYLRVGAPILSIGPSGDNQDLVKKYSPFYEVARGVDSVEISDAITKMYKAWLIGDLKTNSSVNQEYESVYERKNITKELVRCFDDLIDSN